MKISLKRAHRVGGKMRASGEEVSVSRRDGKVLVALSIASAVIGSEESPKTRASAPRKATQVSAKKKINKPTKPESTKRGYNRRDMRAKD